MSDVFTKFNEQELKVHLEYSKWALLDKIYTAKKQYYSGKKHTILDSEYDALESTFTAIHGKNAKEEFVKVGYSKEYHEKIKKNKLDCHINILEVLERHGLGVSELEELRKSDHKELE